MADDFNLKTTGFWGALAAFFWSLPKLLEYLKTRKNQKLNEGIEKALFKENKMEDIVKGNIGSIGSYDLDLKEGKLILSAGVNVGGGIASSESKVQLDACAVLDLIASKIPGTFDDAVIAMAKDLIKKL